MPDHRQQRDAARTERDQLRREVADLRAIIGDLDPAYASAYRDLCDLAYHGLRRPDDLGGPITTGHAESRPPKYDSRAYHLRNEERRRQRIQAGKIRHLIERIDDPTTGSRSVAAHHTPLTAFPSQNGHSPTRAYGTISLSVRRAPIGAPEADTA